MGKHRAARRTGPGWTRLGARWRAARGTAESSAPTGEQQSGDEGYVLLESIISITLITVIMAALGVFFTTTIRSSSHLRRDQSAAQLADSAVEQVRSIDPTSVVSGRDSASVNTENGAAPATVTSNWLNTMTAVSDPNAPAGAGQVPCPSASSCALLPTIPVSTTLNGQAYKTSYYVGSCYRAQTSPGTDCTPTGSSGYIKYLRVVVSVSWPEPSCSNNLCLYLTSTLVDPSSNPIFNLNSAPPPAPNASTPANQTSAVGDTVSLSLTASSGVPPFTWTATNLPAGLAIAADGTITGSPTTVGAARTVTATVTDAFLRTDSTTFTWTVVPQLVANQPADQSSTWHSAISTLTLTASGGSGSGYVWSDPSSTLPPGLSLSSGGAITGTPTAVGNYAVQVGVKDSANRTDTVSFNWVVSYPALTASQSNVSSTVATATSLTLAAAGGSGNYTWSDPTNSLAAAGLGLSLTPAGLISGTPTVSRTYSISVLVTDSVASMSRTVNFTWTVVTLPTVMSPGDQAGTVGRPVNVPLTYNCTAAPCTITATNLPPGLSISGGAIVGTLPASVTGNSDSFGPIQLTIKDATNRSTNAASTFTWTVNAAPTIIVTGQLDITGGNVDAVPGVVSKGTGPYTFSISNKPTGTSMTDTTIGEITGVATTTQTLSGLKITVVDASGYSVTSAAFTWTVKATVGLRNVASTSFCDAIASNGGGYKLTAGSCGSPVQLTYLSSGLLQFSGPPTLCLKAMTTTPNIVSATCDSTSTAQQWVFNADNSITSVSTAKCLMLPTGASNGTALTLASCTPMTTRMQWTLQ
ncbi:MAG TPA: putative Ig domain-containing protein [Jatrophihabitans sp.]|nr:putative Ig domain-containing protein [Jatrophihabitans sp.]